MTKRMTKRNKVTESSAADLLAGDDFPTAKRLFLQEIRRHARCVRREVAVPIGASDQYLRAMDDYRCALEALEVPPHAA